MSEESTQLILGDAAVDALGQPPRRRGFFRRRTKKEAPPLTHCENCGAAITGKYCAVCGQQAIDYRRSLLAVLADAADSFFNWDTKFLKSIGVLLAKPWKLTNDFNAGRRARYVHPLRLYLVASVAFFLIVKLVNLNTSGPTDLKPEDRAEVAGILGKMTEPGSIYGDAQKAQIESVRAKILANGALTSAERAEVLATTKQAPEGSPVPKEIRRKQRAELAAALARIPRAPAVKARPGDDAFIGPLPENFDRASLATAKEPSVHFGPDDGKPEDQTPFGRWIQGRIKDKIGQDGTKSQLFLDTLRSNIPTMMLCCIPLFAFVLKLLYLRQRRYYVEHLVYALHIHTFAYLGAVIITLLAMGEERWLPGLRGLTIGLLVTALVVQVFLSIRRVYGQGWFFTALKFFLGGFAYLMILVFAVATTALVTLFLPG